MYQLDVGCGLVEYSVTSIVNPLSLVYFVEVNGRKYDCHCAIGYLSCKNC